MESNEMKIVEGLNEIGEGNLQEEDNIDQYADYDKEDEVFFAFIDVLGFSKTFSSSVGVPEKEDVVVDKYKQVFNYYFALMDASNMIHKAEKTCAGQTSDSLYFYTERPDVMIEFMKLYSHFSLFAMSQDIFFRGGISKGCLYRKKPYQFFGDSVIKAYSLESGISKYPIVTIDQKASKDLIGETLFKRITKTNDDKRRYLDPFACWGEDLRCDFEDTFSCKTIDYESVKKNIERNKERFEYDEKNYGKYLFLSTALAKMEGA